MKLVDRADGVRGHFCIGREIKGLPGYWEFWSNYLGGGWCSAGTVFTSQAAAEFKMKQLEKQHEPPQPQV